MRAGKAAEELPDGPVDEEVQEGLVEAFRQQQEVQERLFSSLLVIISLPLFVFFVWHSYQQLLDPWSWPFSGLKEADQFGRMLASSAHVITGLSIILSFVSTLAHKKLREFRKALLIVACVLVVLAGGMWLRVLLSTPSFPWEYAGFFGVVLLLPLLLQWYVVNLWESTRKEIRHLEGLKYRCRTA